MKKDSYDQIGIPKNPGGTGSPAAPNKNSKRSARRKRRKFVSLEVSSRKHRRATGRMYLNTDAAHKKKGKVDYH